MPEAKSALPHWACGRTVTQFAVTPAVAERRFTVRPALAGPERQ
jgi:hypothetical protein